jgi:ATP/maltotriose-dependent transcriptional regulator MalT
VEKANAMVALIGLYEENEKPEDPLNYLLSAIQSASGKQAEELQAVREENEKLKERIAELEEKVAQMSGSGSAQVEAQPQQVS